MEWGTNLPRVTRDKWRIATRPFTLRPRIFSLMLTAFAMVIVLGIGGMIGFFGLAVADFRAHELSMRARPEEIEVQQAMASSLAEYYALHGSWQGIRQRDIPNPDGADPSTLTYVLVDAQNQVLVSTQPDVAVGERLIPSWSAQRVPVELGDQRVGMLVFKRDFTFGSSASVAMNRDERFVNGVLSAALALAAILLALAAFFSSRISQPLRRLTGAAQALAAGDMQVRVQHYRVREIDELGQMFNRMADSLVRADQQRRQLTADVAHELRTPLSIIKGRLEGIQDGIYTATPEQIGDLLDKVDLLERLIEDLRLLALADAGQLPLYREMVDPAHLLYNAARSFAHQAAERHVRLDVQIDDDLAEIQVDPQRITQVLSNLVGNALRYTPTDGTITLRVELNVVDSPSESAAPALVFRVSDTGIGIEPADLPHIFDRFYRADRARARSSGGAGLGLAIARRIVEAHGGQIWAESVLGQGTTIAFSLPLHAAALAPAELVD